MEIRIKSEVNSTLLDITCSCGWTQRLGAPVTLHELKKLESNHVLSCPD